MSTWKKIEDLETWNLARELNNIAFSFFDRIKSAHDFSLLDQMSRSCGSIMDNAEGFGRGGNKEFIYFLSIAKASGEEFRSQLYRAFDRKYITKQDFDNAYEHTDKTCSKIGSLIRYLSKSKFHGPKFQTNQIRISKPYMYTARKAEYISSMRNEERGTRNEKRETRNEKQKHFLHSKSLTLLTTPPMETIELQKTFFQHIKNKLPAHISFAEEIAEVLEISTDSSYRRIRGEKPITFEEIKKLCETYSVSLDHILSLNINSTVFFGDWVDAENFNFEKYLEDMLFQVKQIVGAPKKLFYYEAKDIPPFYHFQFPDLAAFKYFFWMKTILSYDKYNKTCFEEADLDGIIKKTGKEIFRTYSKLPSSEIWGPETVNSTLRQIEFYKDSGVFKSRDTIRNLYEQLLELINHVEKQAERGEKFIPDESENGTPVPFQLFCNEVFLGHNSIYFEVSDVPNVFINHGVLNYMITRNKRFCDYTKKSFENTMKKSSLISGVNEKERFRYFKNLKDKIENRVGALKSH